MKILDKTTFWHNCVCYCSFKLERELFILGWHTVSACALCESHLF